MQEHYIVLAGRAKRQKDEAVEVQRTEPRRAAKLFYDASQNYMAAHKQESEPQFEYFANFCLNRAEALLTPPRKRQPISGSGEDSLDEDTEKLLRQVRACFGAPPEKNYSDVAGLVEAKKAIEGNVIELLKPENRKHVLKLKLESGYGVVLYGPPGCGKTYFALATAGQLNAPLFKITAGDVVSKWVGDPERTIKLLFSEARDCAKEHGYAVIFLDEFETLVRARGSDSAGYADRWVAQFLTEMDGLRSLENILVLAATNLPGIVDPAIVRSGRFSEQIYVGLPDIDARTELFKLGFKGVPTEDLDYKLLAKKTEGFSGSDIASERGGICRGVRKNMLSVYRDVGERPIKMGDIVEVIKGMRKSVDKQQLAAYQRFAKAHGQETPVEDRVLAPILQPITRSNPKKKR